MSLTLVEAAKLAANRGETVRAAVIAMFAQASDILRVMPWMDIQGNAYSYNREGALPGIAFRGVNESYTASTGIINPLTESLRIAGGDLDVDKFIVDTLGMGVRATHESLKVKSLAASVTKAIIKGDSTSDPREFDGLQSRITGSQLIENHATTGGPLSLLKLDELVDAVTGVNYLLMNKAMRRRLTAAARDTSVGGFITTTLDEFGRQVTRYNGIPILVPYADNGGVEPLAFDEAAATGGSTSTSIYALGLGDGLMGGIQSGGMQVRDLGELDETPAYRTRVEWYPGLVIEHGRAAGRLRGITDAEVTK